MNYEDIGKAQFWEEQWQESKRSSFLSESQAQKPDAWLDFFNSISDIYLKIWGNGEYFGNAATRILISEGLVSKGSEVLDAGCGPGTLAIPMAEQGIGVTGLDYSPAMLSVLAKEASERNISNIEIICSSFESFSADKEYDLVTASFVPPSLNPSGIAKMESWTKEWCAVMVGADNSAKTVHQALWQEVMERPSPASYLQLIYLSGYLVASGRMPNIKHISNRYRFKCPLKDFSRFYTAYFGMFRDDRKYIEQKIDKALRTFIKDDCVEYEDEMKTCLVWWKKQ